MTTCPSCRHSIFHAERLCPNCGAALTDTSVPTAVLPSSKQREPAQPG
ncbi:MAG: zinc ribbon domain-containing protein, partial [Acidobacteriota bacterium]